MFKLIQRLICVLLLLALLGVGGLTLAGYRLYQSAIGAQPLTTTVARVRAEADYTPADALPDTFCNALIAVEDRNFYNHNGINPVSIVRALLSNLQAKEVVEGGSTITQQLAKNLYFSNEPSFLRKIAEMFVAFDLEAAYTKTQILELYANTIYYGDGYYGVAQASLGYFGCAPLQMTDDQCTLLAGIPNAPSAYALSEHEDLARQRQQQVLNQMVNYEYLTPARRAEIEQQILRATQTTEAAA